MSEARSVNTCPLGSRVCSDRSLSSGSAIHNLLDDVGVQFIASGGMDRLPTGVQFIAPLRLSLRPGGEPIHSSTAPWQGRHKCPTDLYIAILIDGLHFSSYSSLAVGLVFFRNGARAGYHIIKARHAPEAHAKFAQRCRSYIIA